MTLSLFDQDFYLLINRARWAAVETIFERIGASLAFSDAYDVGCGPGWFIERLLARGLDTVGLEGREDVAAMARHRVPDSEVMVVDLDNDPGVFALPPRDLVLCVGLLYHVENPFRVIRALRAMTGKILILETQCAPVDGPFFQLVVETPNETQGLTHRAVIPSECALAHMLAAAGFVHLYNATSLVGHPDFIETQERFARRRMVVASHSPLPQLLLPSISIPPAPKLDTRKTRGV